MSFTPQIIELTDGIKCVSLEDYKKLEQQRDEARIQYRSTEALTLPKTFISHKDGDTTITWTGYGHPVNIQKCLSLESGEWTTISKDNFSGKFVDVDAKESVAFYRLSYVTKP